MSNEKNCLNLFSIILYNFFLKVLNYYINSGFFGRYAGFITGPTLSHRKTYGSKIIYENQPNQRKSIYIEGARLIFRGGTVKYYVKSTYIVEIMLKKTIIKKKMTYIYIY